MRLFKTLYMKQFILILLTILFSANLFGSNIPELVVEQDSTVVIDTDTDVIENLVINGTLLIPGDTAVTLNVINITVGPTGVFQIGSDTFPATGLVRVMFHPEPLNYEQNNVGLMSMGKIRFYGAEPTEEEVIWGTSYFNQYREFNNDLGGHKHSYNIYRNILFTSADDTTRGHVMFMNGDVEMYNTR